MVSQGSIIKLNGTIDGISFYKSEGRHLARKAGGVSAQCIASAPAFGRPNPHVRLPLISCVGEPLLATGYAATVAEYGLAKFGFNVLSLERPFAEKMLVLVRASYAENPAAAGRKLRHLYDLHYLIARDEVAAALQGPAFFGLLAALACLPCCLVSCLASWRRVFATALVAAASPLTGATAATSWLVRSFGTYSSYEERKGGEFAVKRTA